VGDAAPAQLAFAAPTLPPVDVRLWRGILVMDSEGLAKAYLERKGNLYYAGHRMVQCRARETRRGWVLCAWHCGVPHLLCEDGKLTRFRAADL